MIGVKPALAAATLALFGLLLAWEATRREPDVPGQTTVAAAPLPESAAPSAAPNPAEQQRWVTTILARPLFSPDRRPRAPEAAAQAAAPPPALPRVAGTMVVGKSRQVIFAASGEGRPLVVAEGAEVNGFRVQSIEPGRVTVVGPGGPRTLLTSFDPNPPTSVAARPAPTFAPGIPGLPSILPPPAGPGAAQTSPALPPGAFAGLPPIPGLPLATAPSAR